VRAARRSRRFGIYKKKKQGKSRPEEGLGQVFNQRTCAGQKVIEQARGGGQRGEENGRQAPKANEGKEGGVDWVKEKTPGCFVSNRRKVK